MNAQQLGIVTGSRRANPHSIAIAKDSVCFRAVRRRVIVPSIPSVLWTSPRQISVFGPSSSRPSRKSGFPDLIDNTFGSTPPALGRGYASRVNVPVRMPGALRITHCACSLSTLSFSHKALAHNNKTALGKSPHIKPARRVAHLRKIVARDRDFSSELRPSLGPIRHQRLEKMMSNQQKTIAVVDDDPEMRCAMRNLLSALGYIGKTYDTAKTFLNCASTCEASCLVLDVQLGDISGIELAHRLAADGFRFPIIFMTGLDDEIIRKQAAAAGGIAFLRKPFSAETLAGAITKAVDTGLRTAQSSSQSGRINADKVFSTHSPVRLDQSLSGRLST